MTSPYVVQVRKEARALLPWWAGAAFTTTAVSLFAQRHVDAAPSFRSDLEIWVALAHLLGVFAVAAVSLGHELTHNTLSSFLAQPISRVRMLATKAGVLIPAVITLGIVGNLLFVDWYLPTSSDPRALLVWGPVVAGITLVPLLTVLTRKPLGGVVFSIAIPGLILAGAAVCFPYTDSAQLITITWYGTLAVCAIAVPLLWHRFTTLETAGDAGIVTSRGWRRRRTVDYAPDTTTPRATPRHWTWLFVIKELRLQQMSLAVSGLYVLACAVVAWLQHDNPRYAGPTFETLTGFHGLLIAVMAGALASAEERHLGTLAPQVLMPKAAWRQFSLKIAVTVGLAVTLGVGLPLLLMATFHPPQPFDMNQDFAGAIVLAVVAAMYVSSISSNNLWALLSSVGGVAVSAGALTALLQAVRYEAWRHRPEDYVTMFAAMLSARATGHEQALDAQLRWISWLESESPFVLGAVLAGAILYFAARNHRSLDRQARTVIRQVLMLALLAVCLIVAQVNARAMAERWVFHSWTPVLVTNKADSPDTDASTWSGARPGDLAPALDGGWALSITAPSACRSVLTPALLDRRANATIAQHRQLLFMATTVSATLPPARHRGLAAGRRFNMWIGDVASNRDDLWTEHLGAAELVVEGSLHGTIAEPQFSGSFGGYYFYWPTGFGGSHVACYGRDGTFVMTRR